MNEEHPHPNNSDPRRYSATPPDAKSEVRETHTMHTSLADLLDSVAITAENSIQPVQAEDDRNHNSSQSDLPDASAENSHSAMTPLPDPSVRASLENRQDRTESEIEQSPQTNASILPAAEAQSLNTDDIAGRETNTAGASATFSAREGNSPLDMDASKSSITIKGRGDGISVEIGVGSWRMLMVQLRSRLQQSSGFFRGGSVALDVGSRALMDDELQIVSDVFAEHGMKLTIVRSSSEETGQSASNLGITAKLDATMGSVSQMALSNHETLTHFVYRGNLRSGQILRRAETLLILGDVNPGAQVISEGDILIWGRLRGIAHAGASGDESAIVAALAMAPTQLRIGQSIGIMPESDNRRGLFGPKKRRPELAPRPEIAYVASGQITVEPWDESKPGGIMAFRRSL